MRHTDSLHGEITPTSVIIKNIPFHWKTADMLHVIDQRKLPSPQILTYLYDDSFVFRGLAFAAFASSEEAWRIILDLNTVLVCGRRLRVQFKRKRPQLMARENFAQREPVQTNLVPPTNGPAKAYPHPEAKASSATRSTRERTPPSESYDLLMSYQTSSVEKEKLKRFLAQTGDYQEAVNEFAKNRARETQAGEHGWCMEDGSILERRPATPGEQVQIEWMEGRLGFSDGPSSSGSSIVRHEGEQDVTRETKDRLTQSGFGQ